MARGYEPDTIKALLRWQSDESLRMCARLNMGQYAHMLQGTFAADISSVSTANLELLSTDATFFQQSETFVKDLEELPDPLQDKEAKAVSRRHSV